MLTDDELDRLSAQIPPLSPMQSDELIAQARLANKMQARVDELTELRGRSEQGGPYDFESMSREELVEAVKNELHDVYLVCGCASPVFCYVTGWKVSKPHTDPSVVMAMADDHYSELAKEELTELHADIARVTAERDQWRADHEAMEIMRRESLDVELYDVGRWMASKADGSFVVVEGATPEAALAAWREKNGGEG